MYEPRMTKAHAITAARWLIVDFHENLPVVDDITDAIIFNQFQRELSAAVQHDMDVDTLVGLLENLDQIAGLDEAFPVSVFDGLPLTSNDDIIEESGRIADVFFNDLKRAFANYSPRAEHYFQDKAA